MTIRSWESTIRGRIADCGRTGGGSPKKLKEWEKKLYAQMLANKTYENGAGEKVIDLLRLTCLVTLFDCKLQFSKPRKN